MTFLRIRTPHPYLSLIQPWYEGAFPVHERRSFDELLALLAQPEMHLCALLERDQLVGFMIYWQWDALIYVEHFAIDPQQRGKQHGQQALAALLRFRYRYVLLEVELPTDDTSIRRIQFYERQGFVLNPYAYEQPPYQIGKAAVPMKLMSTPAISHPDDFSQLSALLKERVYERFYTSIAP